jgi:hypothetical protein
MNNQSNSFVKGAESAVRQIIKTQLNLIHMLVLHLTSNSDCLKNKKGRKLYSLVTAMFKTL